MPAMAQVAELGGHVLGGKYRLVRAVSEGPRKVYEARHERLTGRFALKQWPATTPWDVFRRGAELAVTLRHPGVMQVLDFNCEPGSSPFLVLEWIDGTRLSDVIAESGIMAIERVAPLIESAAWALASAHQQGVVHQELRPDEVFVVHAPGTMREWVKIAGFGVSASLAREGAAPPSRYRAPEQKGGGTARAHDREDDEGADPQSDQYSLAAIAYEMLAGVPPFPEARAGDGARDEGSRAEPLPISDLAPGVSPAVDAAIRQALAAEPEQRFAGVLEFARALRDAVDGASPEALRRRSAASASPERRARGPESVSPFFNPLQGRAGEVLRRVVSKTAKLRTLGRLGEPMRAGGRPTARIALAGTTLILAVAATTLVLRKKPTENAATRPAAVAEAPRPAPPPAPAADLASPKATAAPASGATMPAVAVRADVPPARADVGDPADVPGPATDGAGDAAPPAKRGRAEAGTRRGRRAERRRSSRARPRRPRSPPSPPRRPWPRSRCPRPPPPRRPRHQ
jgi:serine/threonine-protein kinase